LKETSPLAGGWKNPPPLYKTKARGNIGEIFQTERKAAIPEVGEKT